MFILLVVFLFLVYGFWSCVVCFEEFVINVLWDFCVFVFFVRLSS